MLLTEFYLTIFALKRNVKLYLHTLFFCYGHLEAIPPSTGNSAYLRPSTVTYSNSGQRQSASAYRLRFRWARVDCNISISQFWRSLQKFETVKAELYKV